MKRSNIWFLVVGAVALVMMSSLIGVILYKTWFESPAAYYLTQPSFVNSSPYQQAVNHTENGEVVPPVGPSFIQASSKARPAVVHIRASFRTHHSQQSNDFFSNPFKDQQEEEQDDFPQGIASGSGVLISSDGYIATNNHVVEDADEIEVTLFDNRRYKAELIGRDASTDLALIKISENALPFLAFANSDDVQVGQWVLAVGNPMDLTSTVTAGIVSAKGRNINLLRSDSRYAIESFIQTDAAVNKGNSGGALVDEYGNLVGINTAIASRTGYFAGYSFAIPATIARKVMEDFVAYGEVRRGFLGVQIQPMNAELADITGLDIMQGAYVSSVNQGLGAADAGIKEGDVIISVNEISVNSSSELQEQVSRFRPGDKIKIVAFRRGEKKTFIVALKGLDGVGLPAADLRSGIEFKGSRFRLLTEEEATTFGLRQGVMVESIGSAMKNGGVEKGLVILEVDGKEIFTIEDLERALLSSNDYVNIKGMYEVGKLQSYSFEW
ncbi:MAG: trypsin-like peptidase domain-containing protein [Bacteroidia bacterium]|nr:trypsin-like peptidase domain-containing protein [Bacteroidia bacterium]